MRSTLPILSLSLVLAGCGAGTDSGAPSPSPTPYTSEMVSCLEQANGYRTTLGLRAISRSTDLESYATKAAENDGKAHTAHGYFRATNGGGIAMAENEIPWTNMAAFGTVSRIVQIGISSMWAEGPGGGHYENIRGPYTQGGCGVYVGNGEATIVQAFR